MPEKKGGRQLILSSDRQQLSVSHPALITHPIARVTRTTADDKNIVTLYCTDAAPAIHDIYILTILHHEDTLRPSMEADPFKGQKFPKIDLLERRTFARWIKPTKLRTK